MLAIGEKDIQQAVNLQEVMDCVEESLRVYVSGDFFMPLRSHVDHGQHTLLLMPCFSSRWLGTKLVTVSPQNAAQGLPVINAVMVVNRADTGQPEALLNGQVLTAMRTGAVGGVGVRWLSPDRPHGLGLVGAGVQGYWQARFAVATGKIKSVFVFDRVESQAASLCARLAQDEPGLEVTQAKSADELLDACETFI
ncbi:MAG: hypothetical protein PVG60_02270, partial [Desulfarculaceae bacterium]